MRNRKAYLACHKFYHGILDIPDLEVRAAGLDAENYENYLVITTVLACVVKQIQDQLKEKYIPNENPFLVLEDLFQQIELDQWERFTTQGNREAFDRIKALLSEHASGYQAASC